MTVRRPGTLRRRVVVATGLTAAVTVIVALFGSGLILRTLISRSARAESQTAARVLTILLTDGASDAQLHSAALGFADDRIVVDRSGRSLLLGVRHLDPDRASTTTATVPGGRITAEVPFGPTNGLAYLLGGVLVVTVALMLTTGLVAGSVASRGMTDPVLRMVDAADRVADGDFRARIGELGSAEMARLGHAFDTMAARLEESDLQQRQFLGDIAHEIATPINVVSGFALAIADGTVRSDEERLEAIESITSGTDRVSGLLTALRRLQQLDLAQVTDMVPFDAARVVDGVARRLSPEARAAEVDLHTDIEPADAVGDPRVVEMIVENLVSNAIHYTPSGGSVDVSLRRVDDRLHLRVRDTGIGIAVGDQERVFDRLYRVDAARTRTTGGFGVGLALVRRGAHALGGHVELRSAPGLGSEFAFIFPGNASPPPGGPLVAATAAQGAAAPARLRVR